MPFVQFRIHPGVGCARMGNSDKAYYLACEFPYFVQEEFPKLRWKPKPRVHPRSFFSDEFSRVEPGPAGFKVYDPAHSVFADKFKEGEGKVFPQAVRFRVFAYVYDEDDSPRPSTVFEVTTELAEIVWSVNIANKKSVKTTAPAADPDENLSTTAVELDTTGAVLECKRVLPLDRMPNLAYLFLERDDADVTKVTGRLHVIGNEGELLGSSEPKGLWSDDWYDSAGDGPVTAVIKPKAGGAALRARAGAASVADLKYLAYGTASAQAGSTASIAALPAWVVVGCPDYTPDMGHFVSLYDVAWSRAYHNLESCNAKKQDGHHKLICDKCETDSYKKTDYLIHIHPHMCLFEDVRYVSGDTVGDPETNTGTFDRGHNKHPGGAAPAPAANDDKTRDAAINHGGVVIRARARKAELMDPKALKDPDPKKPINDWLKIAVFRRLRKPGTVYDKRRKFLVRLPGSTSASRDVHAFPRKFGRRMDYDGGPDKGKMYQVATYKYPEGNLRRYHGLSNAGSLCGGSSSPPTAGPPGQPALTAAQLEHLQFMDDAYWPATFADMPMLRELAYTQLQYDQFQAWQASDADVRIEQIFDILISPEVKVAFALSADPDRHFADFLKERPLYAPAILDMAHLGTMIGGSFMPGIEVGREAAIASNWCLYHGASRFFPCVRFKFAGKPAEHTLGTLTKDLAIPWSKDFASCDESFWPTARPGRTTKDGTTRIYWLLGRDRTDASTGTVTPGDVIPHLGHSAGGDEYPKEYWKALGFIRRNASDEFVETEQSWH